MTQCLMNIITDKCKAIGVRLKVEIRQNVNDGTPRMTDVKKVFAVSCNVKQTIQKLKNVLNIVLLSFWISVIVTKTNN